MSRSNRALLASAFAYAQYAVSIAVSIVLVPMVLRQIDVRTFGLWLACADLFAYIGLLDLGVFGVLPWLIAEADGRADRPGIRRALSNALAVAAAVAVTALVTALAAWTWFGGLLNVTSADREALAVPLLILVTGTVASLPLNVFGAALIGLQDVKFAGYASLARVLLHAGLTLSLLSRGWGLYAIALGSAFPALAAGVAGVVRFRARYRALAREWPRPSAAGMRWLAQTSIGSWLGAFGWKLLSMSNGLVLAASGNPELVPLYSCTARLSAVLLQMGWIIPDSGLVPFAQLYGEGRLERLRSTTRALIKLHLIIAGASATVLLAVNPAFVSWWVSEALFGGDYLNVLLAAGVLVASLTHALATIASVVGRRLEVGVATLANGVVQVGTGYALTLAIGFQGLAVAALLGAAVTMLPVGLRLVARETGVSQRDILRLAVLWISRAWWLLVVAAAIGLLVPPGAVWLAAALWVPVGALYVWNVRPLYDELPLDPRFRGWLVRLRLVPRAEPIQESMTVS